MVLYRLIWLLMGLLVVLFAGLIRSSLASLNGPVASLPTSLITNPSRNNKDVAIVAAIDGTFHLVDPNTREVRWSFHSGSKIYSSYQADSAVNPIDKKYNASESNFDEEFYYLDCGEDWELYLYSNRAGQLQKVGLSADEYIRRLPYVSPNGQVTLGLKKTSAYIVDATTGKLIKSFTSDSFPSSFGLQSADNSPVLLVNGDNPATPEGSIDTQHVIYLTRTDYVLRQYSPNSTAEVLWSLAFANIEAEFRCLRIGTSLSGITSDAVEDPDEKQWNLPCQMKTNVLRIRDLEFLESDKFPVTLLGYSSNLLPVSDGGALVQLPTGLFGGSDNGNAGHILNSGVEHYFAKRTAPLPLPSSGEERLLALPMSEQQSIQMQGPSPLVVKNSVAQDFVAGANGFLWQALSATVTLSGLLWYTLSAFKRQRKLIELAKDEKSLVVVPKKKKGRKAGNKNAVSSDRGLTNLNNAIEGHLDTADLEQNGRKLMLGFFSNVDGVTDGRRVGKLFVSNKEIAKGSNGTVVLEGMYDGRAVAVKRLVQSHHAVAVKEIQNLIASDQHSNIVRWYGVEHDTDFIYIALERCTCNLNDLIYAYSENIQVLQHSGYPNLPEENSKSNTNVATALWKPNGYPSQLLLNLIRDVVRGLTHLHELGMIHRDLKPQNVLILNEKSICAKISDMGISKRLVGDVSALTQYATGCGSSGWRAPEQLQQGRQTRAVDLFSLGCVIFFCITGGKHPFGDSIERDVNILNNKKDLFLVEHIPEVMDLLSSLLHPKPDQRPKARDVLSHPLFWSPDKRLSFLQDASDRVELEDREVGSELLDALERSAMVALNGKWDDKLEPIFINNIGRYRRYRYDSIRDLLRVIRNKSHHYRELPQEVKDLLGFYPDGFEAYFSHRFPKLLVEVYKVFRHFCKDEQLFRKYTDSCVTS